MFHSFLLLNRYVFVNIDLPHKSFRIYREIHYMLQIYCKVFQRDFSQLHLSALGALLVFFLLSFIGRGQTRASCMLYVSCATQPHPDSKSHFFLLLFFIILLDA